MVPDFRQNILQLDSYLLGGVLFTTGKNAVILHNFKIADDKRAQKHRTTPVYYHNLHESHCIAKKAVYETHKSEFENTPVFGKFVQLTQEFLSGQVLLDFGFETQLLEQLRQLLHIVLKNKNLTNL